MLASSPSNGLNVPKGLEKILSQHSQKAKERLRRYVDKRRSLNKIFVGVPKEIEDFCKDQPLEIQVLSLASFPKMNDEVIAYVLKRFPQLKTLDLSSTKHFTWEGFAPESEEQPYKLQELILDYCDPIGEGIYVDHSKKESKYSKVQFRFTPGLLTKLFERKTPNADVVKKLVGIVLGYYSQLHFVHKDLVRIPTCLPFLRSLSLNWLSWMTECTLRNTVSKCENLSYLSVSHCNNAVSDDSIAYICEQRSLKGLSVNFCKFLTDYGLLQITTNCSQTMFTLDICSCKQLTPEGLKKAFSVLPYLKNMDCSLLPNAVTDDVLLTMSKHCPLLEKLDFQGDRMVTGAGIQVLVKTCQNLKYLNLLYTSDFTEDQLQSLASLSNLRALIIPRQWNLTDDILIDIFQKNPKLQLLNVSNCTQLTDKSLDYIANHFGEKLREIDVSGCLKITESSVLWLVNQGKGKLKKLTLTVIDEQKVAKTAITLLTVAEIKEIDGSLIVEKKLPTVEKTAIANNANTIIKTSISSGDGSFDAEISNQLESELSQEKQQQQMITTSIVGGHL